MPVHYRHPEVTYRPVPLDELAAAINAIERAISDYRRGLCTVDEFAQAAAQHAHYEDVTLVEVFSSNAQTATVAEELVDRNERSHAYREAAEWAAERLAELSRVQRSRVKELERWWVGGQPIDPIDPDSSEQREEAFRTAVLDDVGLLWCRYFGYPSWRELPELTGPVS
ncbi:hypothetical protein [Botrimarina hoheduenensis]|uniref:Uncharacterized protein n=1 Tax=Botrimarina hoheduenensis TaxID=2528000 RepID=A0A5C5VZW7_9BACT|nr:hypothetical protein [Botrimarina hoheduenensis]TWT43465.1 hypothetical protein Pla111_24160 [Botrimarina hoheduenensis]